MDSDKLIREAYCQWRKDNPLKDSAHPDEEAMACFLEGRLSEQEQEEIKAHLLSCEPCSEAFACSLAALSERQVPQELLAAVKNLVKPEEKSLTLEVFLLMKERAWELLNTTGDILVGQELMPAPVLRSRSIRDFMEEITILKDFKDIRVEAKLENKGAQSFDINIQVKQKQTQRIVSDLRITLIKDDTELESYLTATGAVTFEHVLSGRYRVEISSTQEKLAMLLLDIKK